MTSQIAFLASFVLCNEILKQNCKKFDKNAKNRHFILVMIKKVSLASILLCNNYDDFSFFNG